MVKPTNSLDISVIIPAKNEAESLSVLVEDICKVLSSLSYSWEIICVDDGSTDTTWQVILKLSEKIPQVRGISLKKNVGQSFALIAGAEAAKGKNLVTIDADGQNPAYEIKTLLEHVPEASLVFGIRKMRCDSLSKRWISKIANRFRRWFLKDGVQDTGCSLKRMDRILFLKIPRFKGMHRFLPALFMMAGHTYSVCPVDHEERKFGISHYNFFNRSLNVVIDLLGVFWLKKRHELIILKDETPNVS